MGNTTKSLAKIYRDLKNKSEQNRVADLIATALQKLSTRIKDVSDRVATIETLRLQDFKKDTPEEIRDKLLGIDDWIEATRIKNLPSTPKAFLELVDTPTTYEGMADRMVVVNAAENGVEFVAIPTPPEVEQGGGEIGEESDPIWNAQKGSYFTSAQVMEYVTSQNFSTFDGNYSSLAGVPTGLSQFTNDAGFTTQTDVVNAVTDFVEPYYALIANISAVGFSGEYEDIENSPILAPVATSNNYQDLNYKPTDLSEFENDLVGLGGGGIYIPYFFDTDIEGTAEPTFLKYNDTDLNTVSVISISRESPDFADTSSIINKIIAGTTILISSRDSDKWHYYEVSFLQTDGGFVNASVTPLMHNGEFEDGERLWLSVNLPSPLPDGVFGVLTISSGVVSITDHSLSYSAMFTGNAYKLIAQGGDGNSSEWGVGAEFDMTSGELKLASTFLDDNIFSMLDAGFVFEYYYYGASGDVSGITTDSFDSTAITHVNVNAIGTAVDYTEFITQIAPDTYIKLFDKFGNSYFYKVVSSTFTPGAPDFYDFEVTYISGAGGSLDGAQGRMYLSIFKF